MMTIECNNDEIRNFTQEQLDNLYENSLVEVDSYHDLFFRRLQNGESIELEKSMGYVSLLTIAIHETIGSQVNIPVGQTKVSNDVLQNTKLNENTGEYELTESAKEELKVSPDTIKISKFELCTILNKIGIISSDCVIKASEVLHNDVVTIQGELNLVDFENEFLRRLEKSPNINILETILKSKDINGNYHLIDTLIELGLINKEQYKSWISKKILDDIKICENIQAKQLTTFINKNIIDNLIELQDVELGQNNVSSTEYFRNFYNNKKGKRK